MVEEKTTILRQKLIPETWKDSHDALWAELLEEPEAKFPIDKELSRYHDLSALLMHDITGLRIAHLRRTTNGNENKELKRLIDRLDDILNTSHLKEGYYSGRTDRKISAAEDISYQHQIKNRILYSAISEAESWLIHLDMVQEKQPNIGRQIQLNIERRLEAHAKEKEKHIARAGDADTAEQEGTGEEGSEDSGGTDEPSASA